MTEFLAWKKAEGRYFGQHDGRVESYQKPWPDDAPKEMIETSYFGFSIPEHGINAEIYAWAHPAYGVVSGGIFVFQGICTNQLEASYSNWVNYMPMPEDMTNCTYANGITVRMIEALRQWEVSFDDPANQTSLRLNLTAFMPPAFRAVGGHFTQGMKTKGTLVLRGKSYAIDGFTSRDRSWGDPRYETKSDVAPVAWHVPVFSESLAFHDMSFDSPELMPGMAARYPGLEGGKNFLWGYVWKDGELRGVKTSRKRSTYGLMGVGVTRIELEIVDETGEVHELEGETVACVPFYFWPNLACFYGMTKWTYRGLVGYGDTQSGIYEKFIVENLKR